MKFKVGDRVAFIPDNDKGTIVEIADNYRGEQFYRVRFDYGGVMLVGQQFLKRA